MRGQGLIVRPSGGGGGGLTAIVNDEVIDGVGGWIDVGRTPNLPTTTDQNTADSKLGSKLYSVKIGTDRQLIATSTTTNAPATLSGDTIEKIYNGTYTTWSQVPGYAGSAGSETIIPLTLPSDAGMWTTFVNGVKSQTGSTTFTGTGNPNSIQVQQNDPTAIPALPEAQRKNAIVPFPRGRFKVVESGFYTVAKDGGDQTNPYNGTRTYTGGKKRLAADVAGIKLLDPSATASTTGNAAAPYGTNFAYNGVFRKSDLNSTTPWQPGSTLNWVQALFFNPGGPAPFVDTEAGRALIAAAGITPDYQVYDETNSPQID
ncbi:substrate-binding domain-containing protein [Aeromicrobium sp. UC242_57]|uniref:substrate-binding domain-containing protein n=1 Tax=Aeromicrobium sp. UC242_57 TaxID=3374624 RepID=UPI0037A5BCA8